jgi:hypothetical protein
MMAAGYALIFIAILHCPMRRYLRVFLVATAFAALYNVTYEVSLRVPVVVSVALLVRLLPPLEACWNLVSGWRWRICLAGLTASLTVAVTYPTALAWGYLYTRMGATIGITMVCLLVTFGVRGHGVLVQHLRLQTTWMGLHSVFSSTSEWYNSTWPRREFARWAYVVSAMVLVLIYRQVLTSPPAQSGDSEAGPGHPSA